MGLVPALEDIGDKFHQSTKYPFSLQRVLGHSRHDGAISESEGLTGRLAKPISPSN
jgi:hypothetical protein